LEERIIDLLRRLAQKISELKPKIDEMIEGSIIFEETKVPARQGEFEGKTYSYLPNGGLVKEIRISVCDECGRKGEELDICSKCGKKVCINCSLIFRNKIYCKECMSQIIPLEKEDYEILKAIYEGNKSLIKISRVTKINKEKVREIRRNLLELGLIEKKGVLFFATYELTELGEEALETYSKIYDRGSVNWNKELSPYFHSPWF